MYRMVTMNIKQLIKIIKQYVPLKSFQWRYSWSLYQLITVIIQSFFLNDMKYVNEKKLYGILSR